METTNNVQKKGNRPIKKTITKMLAIVLSLVLISFTVSAQGFWKLILVNNTYGKMAELMVEQKNDDDQLLKVNNPAFATNSALLIKEEPAQDNWQSAKEMTFETYFGSNWSINQSTLNAPTQLKWRLDGSTFGN